MQFTEGRKLILHIKYAALALALVAAPAFSRTPGSLDAWIPTGWKLISTAAGDLNRDGVEDVALVLEETNPSNLKPNDGLGAQVLNLNPRRLVVLVSTPNGYRKVFSRDGLLPSEDDDGTPCLVDPLQQGGISVSSGKFIIELGAWLSCGSYGVTHGKFTFRLENDRFRLIGYDYSEFSRSTGEASEMSINYLTGKKKSITGQNEFKDSKQKVLLGKISGKRDFYLDEISLDCYSSDELGCAWRQ